MEVKSDVGNILFCRGLVRGAGAIPHALQDVMPAVDFRLHLLPHFRRVQPPRDESRQHHSIEFEAGGRLSSGGAGNLHLKIRPVGGLQTPVGQGTNQTGGECAQKVIHRFEDGIGQDSRFGDCAGEPIGVRLDLKPAVVAGFHSIRGEQLAVDRIGAGNRVALRAEPDAGLSPLEQNA